MSSATSTYVCPYCRLPSDGQAPSCPNCGAPVDVRRTVDEEGWVEQPPVVDMARIQFGQSHCQISGTYVPVADLTLVSGDSVYFSHHVLLWSDPSTTLDRMPMKGGWSRMMSGLPLIMMTAAGPGHIAFSEDAPGEIIAVPLDSDRSVEVVEHHFLVATVNVAYDWFNPGIWYTVRTGNDTEYYNPIGPYMDRFTCEDRGLLLLHARGNVFVRDLAEGERIYIVPRALVYKDASVSMNIHMEHPASAEGFSGFQPLLPLLRLVGPGRVAMQSEYPNEFECHYSYHAMGPGGTYRDWN